MKSVKNFKKHDSQEKSIGLFFLRVLLPFIFMTQFYKMQNMLSKS